MESAILFKSAQYTACITKAGLSVQNTRTGKGKLIPRGLAQEISTLIEELKDPTASHEEKNYICKCIYNF